MVKGSQGVITTAKNPNAKYKYTFTKKQTISGGNTRMIVKYTYSKLISSLSAKKYSYSA